MGLLALEDLARDLEKLMAREDVRRVVESRIKSFKEALSRPAEDVFREIVFCILAANFTALGSLRIVGELGDRLMSLSVEELAEELRRLGHRFPEARARYIIEARMKLPMIFEALRSGRGEHELRDWLVENIRGLGMKEASHLLRNLGYQDVAIIDFHVLKVLKRYGVIGEFKSLTRRRYLEIENILRGLARRLGLSLAELDLYLWYMDTGKILK
ncbi:MAG: N-glycosylase/DNA lyase [Aigarchaeota archaeon]|nr:N-glycosylase/DNA lyase [Candidatus Wolframiiraptor gerlachensis]